MAGSEEAVQTRAVATSASDSISTGARYTINEYFQLSAGFGYDHRESTTVGRAYDSFSFGVSLDFSHTFAKLPR